MKVYINRIGESEPICIEAGLEESLKLYLNEKWAPESSVTQASRGMSWLSSTEDALSIHREESGHHIWYKSSKKHRLFGIIPTPAYKEIVVSQVADESLSEILRLHYQSDDRLLRVLRKSGKIVQHFD